MKTRNVVILCAVAFIIQIIQVNGADDPRLKSCINKFIEQFDQVRRDKMPSCYDTEKLKQGKQDLAVFQKMYGTLPPKCKKPTKENIGECLKIIADYYNSKSDEMKAGLINSIHSFMTGGQLCFNNLKHVFANLDKYVLNGCQ